MVSRKAKLVEVVAARKEEGEPRLPGNGSWAAVGEVK